MKKFIVLHYSHNWMTDGLANLYFDNLKEAEKYVKNFQGKGYNHKNDSFQIVEILRTGKSIQIDTDLYGFDVK